MLKESGRNGHAPRVELDHRAREARLRLEQLERLLVNNHAVKGFAVFRVFRLLALGVAGGRRGDDSTGSPSDQRPCDIPMLVAPQVA